jgi:hypothetical protein
MRQRQYAIGHSRCFLERESGNAARNALPKHAVFLHWETMTVRQRQHEMIAVEGFQVLTCQQMNCTEFSMLPLEDRARHGTWLFCRAIISDRQFFDLQLGFNIEQ